MQRVLSVAQGSQSAYVLARLPAEAADNGLPDGRCGAGHRRVKGAKRTGTRTGNWHTREKAEALLHALEAALRNFG